MSLLPTLNKLNRIVPQKVVSTAAAVFMSSSGVSFCQQMSSIAHDSIVIMRGREYNRYAARILQVTFRELGGLHDEEIVNSALYSIGVFLDICPASCGRHIFETLHQAHNHQFQGGNVFVGEIL